ncbi:MAG: autotransporter outer membrane beta-barrel domain-containing protein, partial [Hyphomicrobiales bacterium]|nr:autotransporter outer membrane beta-barrel domain-containing protein [Hyphomicrobiales bacterium]
MDGADIQGRIEKLAGATGNVEFRIEGDITANPVRWKNNSTEASENSLHNFGAGDSITIADGARFQFAEDSALNDIPVNLHGRLVFSGVSDNRQVSLNNFRGMGGEIEMDLDFTRGDRGRTSARFVLSNLDNSGMRVPVNIRAVGGLPEFSENEEGEIVIGDGTLDTDGDDAITIGNIITSFGVGTLGRDHFVAGEWLDNGVDDGDWELALVFDDSGGQAVWSVRARPGQQNQPGAGGGPAVPAGPATLFDTLPAVLAHLGQPESMHRRTQNRSFQPSTGVWGKVQTRRLSVEPSAASFESDIHNVTFGVQAPIHTVMLGADVTLQTAETEAVIADGKQDIETNALIAGLAATWERDDLYVDGQFQYARFDNDLNAADGTKLASPTADSFSAGVEVGYVLDAGNLKLGKWLGRGVLSNILVTPSAQVSWSQIGFSDFVAADGKTVSLDDGTVINGRVGIVAETLWESVVLHEAFAPASVRLQGSADVVVPLDGEVVTQVDGANQLSELEDPVLDVGIGVFYTWELGGHAYTLSGDISSRQGSEVEGYEGSLGFKYRF